MKMLFSFIVARELHNPPSAIAASTAAIQMELSRIACPVRETNSVTVIATVADEFVTEVENLRGRRVEDLPADEYSRVEDIVRRKIEPLMAAGADKIVLGCTHFPHLKSVIEKVASGKAEVIEPSEAVARQAARVLAKLGLEAPDGASAKHVFISTSD